jgi:UDP-glucose 4-epimerase
LAHRVGAKTWLGLGSQAEYGPCQEIISENYTPRPTTLYGVSKLTTQMLGERLCQEYGIRFAWLRLFSSYGPKDNPDWLIPYLIRSLMQNEIPKLTAAEQLWDYIYAEDVASAIRAVLESNSANGVFNLGSGNAYMLKNIIEMIRDYVAPGTPLGFGQIGYRLDQVMHLQADISKLNLATGWLPQVEIERGIKETIAWYTRGVYE